MSALSDSPGVDSVPVAATPEAMEKAVENALLGTPIFSDLVPMSRETLGAGSPEEILAMAAETARGPGVEADLLLRVQIRAARLLDLGSNSGTVWSGLLWFMVPLPVWTVDDRSYQADFRIHADLFAPDELQRPVASFVVTAGEQTLDVWDRGPSLLVLFIPPPFIEGNEESVSRTLTERVLGELTRALVDEIRRREIPSRFDLRLASDAAGIRVEAASRRKLRSMEIRIDDRPAKIWVETDLEPDEVSPERGFIYRKALEEAGARGARTVVRAIADDEIGGREVRTLVLKGQP